MPTLKDGNARVNCGPRLLLRTKKRAYPAKCPVSPSYMWCPEPGSNRHVQRTRDFKSVNLSFINIWLAIILHRTTR